eukprot:TRINITY_DN30996_c0_g1_i1.p1 TRINITY_DN30996_c0_g1~~TRINITY_DN30996_c0_g1_i1.p1  ORF type:complete len:604 (-),score=70.68 TRINITY_DN30996_c0_g1_i1:10-1821(-)
MTDPTLPKVRGRKAKAPTDASLAILAAPSLEALGNLASAITLKGAVITEAILHRFKDIENRSVRLPVGCWVALHTGKSKVEDAMDRTLRKMTTGLPASKVCPMGAVVGVCWVERAIHLKDLRIEFDCGAACEHRDETTGLRSLRHVHSCRLSPFAIGPFCNVISAVIRLPRPVPCNGALCCWELPEEVRRQILGQLLEPEAPAIQHVSSYGGARLPRAWPLPWAEQLADPAVERDPIMLPERRPRANKRARGVAAETQSKSRPSEALKIAEDDEMSDDSDLPLVPASCPPKSITPTTSSNRFAGSVFRTNLVNEEHSPVIDISGESEEPMRPSVIDVPSFDAGSEQLRLQVRPLEPSVYGRQRREQQLLQESKPPARDLEAEVVNRAAAAQTQHALPPDNKSEQSVLGFLQRNRYKALQHEHALSPTPVRLRPGQATPAYRHTLLVPSEVSLKKTLQTLENMNLPRPERHANCDATVAHQFSATGASSPALSKESRAAAPLEQHSCQAERAASSSHSPFAAQDTLSIRSHGLPKSTISCTAECVAIDSEEPSPPGRSTSLPHSAFPPTSQCAVGNDIGEQPPPDKSFKRLRRIRSPGLVETKL